VSRQLHNWEF